MAGIKNEHDRIKAEQARVTSLLQKSDMSQANWQRLYDVQQALMWALDPTMVRSPYAMILDIPEEREGYSPHPYPLPSSDTCSHNG